MKTKLKNVVIDFSDCGCSCVLHVPTNSNRDEGCDGSLKLGAGGGQ